MYYIMNVTSKTSEAITLVRQCVGSNVELVREHRTGVRKIREQGWYENVERIGIERRTLNLDVSKVQRQIVEYAKKEIKDEKEMLALVITMCCWQKSAEPSSPTFIHAQPVVDLLKGTPYYRGALLIYQAALYENGKQEGALTRLFGLPTVSKSAEDDMHAMSAYLKGCAYEEIGKYVLARDAFNEIGTDESYSYRASAATKVVFINPMADEEANNSCVIF